MTVRFSTQLVAELYQPYWAAWQAGEFLTVASAVAGTHRKRGLVWLRQAGGVSPRRAPPTPPPPQTRWVSTPPPRASLLYFSSNLHVATTGCPLHRTRGGNSGRVGGSLPSHDRRAGRPDQRQRRDGARSGTGLPRRLVQPARIPASTPPTPTSSVMMAPTSPKCGTSWRDSRSYSARTTTDNACPRTARSDESPTPGPSSLLGGSSTAANSSGARRDGQGRPTGPPRSGAAAPLTIPSTGGRSTGGRNNPRRCATALPSAAKMSRVATTPGIRHSGASSHFRIFLGPRWGRTSVGCVGCLRVGCGPDVARANAAQRVFAIRCALDRRRWVP
jgi:hypothetical protein